MVKAFFSYAHIDWDAPADKQNVQRLVNGLEAQVQALQGDRTFQIWRDEESLRFGDNWRDELQSVLSEVDFLIVLLSPGWLKSDYCGWEFDHFKQSASANGCMLPISLRKLDDRQLAKLNEDQQGRHEELRAIQHKSWANLDGLDDRDVDTLLTETAAAISDRILDLDPPQVGSETGRKAEARNSAIPVDAHVIPPVSGDYYIPPQARDTCQLKLAVPGLASVETEEGTVVFAIAHMTVQTNITGGRIVSENPRFSTPWVGPIATVTRVQTSAQTTSLTVQANSTEMQGEPLAGKGDSGHVYLFEFEAEKTAQVEVTGSVNIRRQAVRIVEEQSDLSQSDQDKREVMLQRLADILLRKHIHPNAELEGACDDRSSGD